jgi:hypothetical protein
VALFFLHHNYFTMKNIFLLAIVLIVKLVNAQDTGNYINQVNNYHILSDGVGQFDYVYKKQQETSSVGGNRYLKEKENPAVVYLKDQSRAYKLSALNYDVYKDLIELNLNGEVKVLSGTRVDELVILNSDSGKKDSLVRCNKLMSGQKMLGFCQIMNEGPVMLVKRAKASLNQASYNTALMVGDKERKIIVSEEYYLGRAGSYNVVKTKGDVKSFARSQGREWSAYKQKINVKNENSLLNFVKYLNQEGNPN